MPKTWCRTDSAEYNERLRERLAALSEDDPAGCRTWLGSVVNGYGRIRVRGRLVLSHRVAYELANGPVPEGNDVLHTCDRPQCIEVAHLFVGDHRANMEDKARKGRAPSKLAGDQVRRIWALIKSGRSCNSIAVEYGVNPHTISDIRDGVTWRHVTKRSR